jgi:hypothetical protein
MFNASSCLPILLIFIHVEHICSFFVAFFSATIVGGDLIFGHKLHIGTPYRGNRFWTQTGSRNLMGPKMLPTIWYPYMMLVTKYQISAINSYWEKCDEKYLGREFLTITVHVYTQSYSCSTILSPFTQPYN